MYCRVSGVSTTITVLVDSVKRVTHGLFIVLLYLTIATHRSHKWYDVYLAISINGCREFSPPFP